LKYACITRHRDEYPVRLMCRVLDVAPSGYYRSRQGSPSCARQIADEGLLLNIRTFHRQSQGRYGAPRIQQDLKAVGLRVGTKRVARLMKREGLVGRQPAEYVVTTDSRHGYPVAPNLIARAFDVNGVSLNQVWVSDLTYLPTAEGWLFLDVVLDLASRRVVGWAIDDRPTADVALRALRMALTIRRPAPGLILHSDRGVQYACDAYRTELAAHGLRQSMSRKGDCWDNAVAESFFATLELELFRGRRWPTKRDVREAVSHFIEVWYNRQRRHSTLKYLSPATYEAQYEAAA
jgi:putative transposase